LHGLLITSLVAVVALPARAQAQWHYEVTWLAGAPASASFADAVSAAVGGALELWTRHLAGGANVEVQLEVTQAVQRASAGSANSGFVRLEPTYALYEQGLAYEIRTGTDLNGPDPDVHIQFNPDYLYNELWFDPSPSMRTQPVPEYRTDAVSVLAHELGHALAFNGWWDQPKGQFPLGYASTWDHNTVYDGSALSFVGQQSVALYGSPVPITLGNNFHVGNVFDPGANLLSDIMNGVAFQRGTRYDVSPLDLAMLGDMGIALSPVPEPPTGPLMLTALGMLVAIHRARRGRPLSQR
jgi:hypothetical protein